MPFAETLSVFFADFGLPCAANSVAFTAIFDQPDDTLGQAGVNVLSTGYLLQAMTSDITAAAIASGTAVTVNGQAFIARDVMQIDDGRVTHITLSK